jgi:hypothetical protein
LGCVHALGVQLRAQDGAGGPGRRGAAATTWWCVQARAWARRAGARHHDATPV